MGAVGLMADTYENFADLNSENVKDSDFTIEFNDKADMDLCVIAPHAGKIEIQSGELAKEIAGDTYCYYLFSGIRTKDNKRLHITSHNFDEPSALSLLAKCQTVLGIHGRKDAARVNGKSLCDKESIYLGGLDKEFIEKIKNALTREGFNTLDSGHEFLAERPNNVCNRGQSSKGAQLELPKSLRERLLDSKCLRKSFLAAIDAAIREHLKTCKN